MLIAPEWQCEWCDGEGRFQTGKRRKSSEECRACAGTRWRQARNQEEARAKIDYILECQTHVVFRSTRSNFLKAWRELGLPER
jgi:hypothetical protein